MLDEKDNKDIKATITQEYDGLRELVGASKDNPNHAYLPDLESKNSESLALLSVNIPFILGYRDMHGEALVKITIMLRLKP